MTAAEAPPQDALRDVLAHRPAMLALATLTVGSLGAAAQATALGYRVFELTRRELDLGWLGLAEFLPSVLLVAVSGPIAGTSMLANAIRTSCAPSGSRAGRNIVPGRRRTPRSSQWWPSSARRARSAPRPPEH